MEGYFILKNNMQISVPFENKKVHQIADDFTKKLSEVSGLYLSISQDNTKADIIFTKDNSLGNEAYLLNIAPERIVVKAATPNGFFYAVQSILQLLPAEICSPDFIGNHVIHFLAVSSLQRHFSAVCLSAIPAMFLRSRVSGLLGGVWNCP